MVYLGLANRSFHVQFPFFLSCIHECEVKQLGELLQTILDKTFWSISDMDPYLFRDLMEMVQLVPNYPY
jgi:hypothetical protein